MMAHSDVRLFQLATITGKTSLVALQQIATLAADASMRLRSLPAAKSSRAAQQLVNQICILAHEVLRREQRGLAEAPPKEPAWSILEKSPKGDTP